MKETGRPVRDEESELVDSSMRGDREAMARRCERYRPSLVSFSFRYPGHWSDAADVDQDMSTELAAGGRPIDGSFRARLDGLARRLERDEP